MAVDRHFGSRIATCAWPVRQDQRPGRVRTFFDTPVPNDELQKLWRRVNCMDGALIAKLKDDGFTGPHDAVIALALARSGPPADGERRLALPGVKDDVVMPILDPYLTATLWTANTGLVVSDPNLNSYSAALALWLLHSGYEVTGTDPAIPEDHVHPSVRLELAMSYTEGSDGFARIETLPYSAALLDLVATAGPSLTDQVITATVDGLPLQVRVVDTLGLVFRAVAVPADVPSLDLTTGTPLAPIPEGYWRYINEDGLPIWDSETGAQLRDHRQARIIAP